MKYPYYLWPESAGVWTSRTGENAKRTLIMASADEIAGNLPFLQKILRAIDLDFEQDIHFVPLSQDVEMQLMADPQIADYEKIIVFGISPDRIGIASESESSNMLFNFEKCICIAAPSLNEIASKRDRKERLWAVLKAVFQKGE